MEKTCTHCGYTRDVEHFYDSKLGADGHQSWCKPCIGKYRSWVDACAREDALAVLGPHCEACGMDDPRVLVIDHRRGGGITDRAGFSRPTAFYEYVAAHPEDYQALCHNCNHLKRLKMGESRKGKYTHLWADIPPFKRPRPRSEQMTEVWADPEYRAKQSASRSASWTDERKAKAKARSVQKAQELLARIEKAERVPGSWGGGLARCLGCDRDDRPHKARGLCDTDHATLRRGQANLIP